MTKGDTNVDVRTEESDMVAPLPPLVGQRTDCSVVKTYVNPEKTLLMQRAWWRTDVPHALDFA